MNKLIISKIKIISKIPLLIFLFWILYERNKYFNHRDKIKEQILKLLIKSNTIEFKNYYNQADMANLISEINNSEKQEKEHLLNTYVNTFYNRSSDSINSLINRIQSFQKIRSIENNNIVDHCLDKLPDKYISCINKMQWFPYILRLLINYLNILTLKKWKKYNNFDTYMNNNVIIYRISNDNSTNKILILFLGLGGILKPFESIVDFFLIHKYTIICPIYKPAQADLKFSFDIHEAEFYKTIYYYMNEKKILQFEIFAWSLGGILYKGFEKFVNIKNIEVRHNLQIVNDFETYLHNNLTIKKVYLIEPLISSRAGFDTYFSQVRKVNDTRTIFNKITQNKYKFLNFLFAYLIHSEIGFTACNSFGYFNNIELKKKININYSRYLFLSSKDVIINYTTDKELIDSNFESKNIFHREGYHGGWMLSNKLIQIFETIII